MVPAGPPAPARLAELLGLDDDELLRVLDADPLSVVGGALDHRPEAGILVDLLEPVADQVGVAALRRWVRSSGPAGRPIELLERREFGAFEAALEGLAQRGFVIRGGG